MSNFYNNQTIVAFPQKTVGFNKYLIVGMLKTTFFCFSVSVIKNQYRDLSELNFINQKKKAASDNRSGSGKLNKVLISQALRST